MYTNCVHKIQGIPGAWQLWHDPARILYYFFLVYYGRITCPPTNFKLNGVVLYKQQVIPGCETGKKKIKAKIKHEV